MAYEALWDIPRPDPDKVMLAPFEYVLAMVGGTRRRVTPERWRALFPLRVRVHPDVYFAVVAHLLCFDGTIQTSDGPLTIRPDPKLRKKDVFVDARQGT